MWLEPALTQAPLLAKTLDAQRLKRLLPYVAYQWREGPWQQALAAKWVATASSVAAFKITPQEGCQENCLDLGPFQLKPKGGCS